MCLTFSLTVEPVRSGSWRRRRQSELGECCFQVEA